MPLFIDLHIDASLTPDLVSQFHVADKAIQEQYGVKYKQVLLNQPQGYLFCLMEAPNKEACAKVHQHAHGNIACHVLEITQSDFSALLANKQKDALDFTINQDGTLDTGNRAILAIDMLGPQEDCLAAKKLIIDILHERQGYSGESFNSQLVSIFDSCTKAVEAGVAIGTRINENGVPIELRMGVDLGPPLKERGNFFEDVCRSADQFAFISTNGQLTMSLKVSQLYNEEINSGMLPVRIISIADQKLLNQIMLSAEKALNTDANIGDFARDLGLSKSQLGRRLKSLVGLSPNDFLKEFRLRKAIYLIKERDLNITEVTMAIGFSNPSYFAKCFRKRFGKGPSEYFHTD